MQSRTRSAAAMSAGSAKSVQSSSTASSHSEDTLSGSQPDEAGSTSRKVKSKKETNKQLSDKQEAGTYSRVIRLTPSSNDPDINALFEARIDESLGQRIFKCLECDMEFPRPYSARRHAKVHLSGKTCAICKERLSGPLSHAIHLKEKHKGQKKAALRSKKDKKGYPEIIRTSSMAEISSKDNSHITHPDSSTGTEKSRKRDGLNRMLTRSKAVEESKIEGAMKEDCERNIKRKKSDDSTMEEALKDFEKNIKRKKGDDSIDNSSSSMVIEHSAINTTKKENLGGFDKSLKNMESVTMPSEPKMSSESVIEEAKMNDLVEAPKSQISNECVIVSSEIIKNEERVIEEAKMNDLVEAPKSQISNESVIVSSEIIKSEERVIVETEMNDLVEAPKSQISNESVIVSSEIIKREESVIEVAKKNYDEMTIENKEKGNGMEDHNDIVVVPPNSEDKTKTNKLALPERRSTRIQMRQAMEASAMEDEMRGISTRTPPIYPSNNEKMKDLQMDLRAVCRRGDSSMPLPENDSSVASTKRASSKRHSRSNSNSVRGSCSRESIVMIHDTSVSKEAPPSLTFADRRSAGGASASNSLHELTSPPIRPRPSSALQTPPSAMTPVATPPQISYPPLAVKYAPGVAAYLINGIGSNHYPRLGGVYGRQVHQHQPTVAIGRNFLYPAPLTATLLRTIYHPAWFKPRSIGADEMYAMSLYGHANLILPVRMRKAGTLMERCLKALEETALPLPPLQPLMPAPCPLLHDMYSDPLSDVLASCPIPPSQPRPFVPQSMTPVPEPKYVTACEGARFQPWSKSEDRRWWEVRTFPSFHSLNSSTPCYPLTTSGRSATTIYSIADKNTRRHAMKYTYVTSKPVFSVLDTQWPSSSEMQQPSTVNPLPSYTTPTSGYPTPSNTPAASGNYGRDQFPGSNPVSSRRHQPPSANAAATRALSWTLPPKKRKAPEEARQSTGSQVEALVKRIKTSFNESSLQQQLAPPPPSEMIVRQPGHQMIQPPEDSYANSMQLQSHYIDQDQLKQLEIKVEQDGTTFTVL